MNYANNLGAFKLAVQWQHFYFSQFCKMLLLINSCPTGRYVQAPIYHSVSTTNSYIVKGYPFLYYCKHKNNQQISFKTYQNVSWKKAWMGKTSHMLILVPKFKKLHYELFFSL